MYPHRIRLRGPWESSNVDGSTRRVDLPGGWHQFNNDGNAGPRMLRRRFGLPRTLDADEQVFLVCRFVGRLACELNGSELGPDRSLGADVEWNITRSLQPRNVLALSFWPADGNAESPEVALEIRGPVYLRDVSATPHGWVGLVVGEDRPNLEVHLLARGRAVTRIAVRTNERFAVPIPGELPEGSYDRKAPEWELELIEMANRWYSVVVTSPLSDLPG